MDMLVHQVKNEDDDEFLSQAYVDIAHNQDQLPNANQRFLDTYLSKLTGRQKRSGDQLANVPFLTELVGSQLQKVGHVLRLRLVATDRRQSRST